ncbi:hypothetical protein CXB51_028876 [Gossypium anomalum]|uniref:RIN4 pathogenic type III effector avirulence factor Avr cleavage site domain-containing protein n=1 Tax=Gossypium anomalum TaxID=47600 RepID=A0A8J5YD68_9ROSI|nr:hypothetical protein CXB51_028876 [Gossypium anomalum]
MDEYCKRSGQIPAFGDWDNANELPITQYFECARQAGLIRFSSSSGESNPYVAAHDLYETADSRKHSRNLAPTRKKLCTVGTWRSNKALICLQAFFWEPFLSRQQLALIIMEMGGGMQQASRVREKGGAHVKEQKKAGRVCDVTEPPRKYYQHPHHHLSLSINNDNTTSSNSKHLKYDAVPPPIPKRLSVRPPKPVDEDLYKIPPELLHSSKRKKMPGFFCCLVPACAT